MKQKLDDITLVEGDNELNIELTPEIPFVLVPCVYCGATFTTETELIAHMESSHPGKPYLIYVVPKPEQAKFYSGSGWWLPISYKIYTPAVPGTEYTATYFFTFYIPGFGVWEPYNGAYIDLRGGTPAGFYEGTSGMYLSVYQRPPNLPILIPPGTYPLYSRCRHRADVGQYEFATIKTFWSGVDTGQTITVV